MKYTKENLIGMKFDCKNGNSYYCVKASSGDNNVVEVRASDGSLDCSPCIATALSLIKEGYWFNIRLSTSKLFKIW